MLEPQIGGASYGDAPQQTARVNSSTSNHHFSTSPNYRSTASNNEHPWKTHFYRLQGDQPAKYNPMNLTIGTNQEIRNDIWETKDPEPLDSMIQNGQAITSRTWANVRHKALK